MAFRLPTFNLIANIWRAGGAGGVYPLPNVITACNLSVGRRGPVNRYAVNGGPAAWQGVWLLLPALTDIRFAMIGGIADLVEVPAGSLRFYSCFWCDDAGKGFANEHRVALLFMVTTVSPFFQPFQWPMP